MNLGNEIEHSKKGPVRQEIETLILSLSWILA